MSVIVLFAEEIWLGIAVLYSIKREAAQRAAAARPVRAGEIRRVSRRRRGSLTVRLGRGVPPPKFVGGLRCLRFCAEERDGREVE
jgi:hypothetical protein